MPFIAELLLQQPPESTVKINTCGSRQTLCVFNEEMLYHIRLSRTAPAITRSQLAKNYWEGVAIDVSADNGVVDVWADPAGVLPVYYTIDKCSGRVVVTDHPKHLIDNVLDATEPDIVGFWQALAFETPLRNRTILRGIGQLGGGEVMTITPSGSVSVQRYWKWNIGNERYASLRFDECVESACEMFVEQMRTHSDEGEILLPLSGGPDSRLAAVLATQQFGAERLRPVTYAYSEISREVTVARRICNTLSLERHELHRLTPQSYSRALCWMPIETGGLVGFANAHLLDYLRSNGGLSGIMSSGFSDALCGYEAHSPRKLSYEKWMNSKKVQKWRSFVEKFNVEAVVDDETMADLESLANAWYDSTITSYDEYLYIVERHVKFHLPLLNLWRQHASVFTPFLSSDLIELFFSMQPQFRINKDLEQAVIHRLSPRVSAIESMSSLVLSGRGGGRMDRLANRTINLANVVLRSIGLGRIEIPSPRITEQLAKALHTSLRMDYADSVSLLEDMGLYDWQQRKRMEKRAIRVGDTLGAQLTALNCAAVYRLKQ